MGGMICDFFECKKFVRGVPDLLPARSDPTGGLAWGGGLSPPLPAPRSPRPSPARSAPVLVLPAAHARRTPCYRAALRHASVTSTQRDADMRVWQLWQLWQLPRKRGLVRR